MLKGVVFFLVPAVLWAASADAGSAAEITFHVSPNGNDQWSGKLNTPNETRTDGPLASLEGARDAIRRMKAREPLAAPVTVRVQGGLYRLTKPFVLEPQDSGTSVCPITYVAKTGERPIFSGGRAITGWKKGEHGIWTATVPEVKAGKRYFRSLFVNGQRRPRARTPNSGYLYAAEKAPPHTDPKMEKERPRDQNAFRSRDGDIGKWDNLDDANILTFHAWTTSRFFVKSIDPESNIVEIRGTSRYPFFRWDKEQRYIIENVPEALDSPGEWYLDRHTGLLSYLALDGEEPPNSEIVAPTLTELVRLRGDADNGRFVQHVTLSGLAFLHTDWTLDPQGGSYRQGAIGSSGYGAPPAVVVDGARNCRFEKLEIAHVGGYAISLWHGCTNNRLEQCHLHDLGAGGVLLGEVSLPEDEQAQTSHNTVSNCFIHDGGHVYASGIGVWIGKSSHNTVEQNDICDFYYTGVSAGWSWGYQPTSAHHNTIAYNHIHHLGFGVLSDMGGIYTLGRSPGTRLHHNLIHQIESYAYGGWGIYTDEGSTGIEIENNVVYCTKSGGFHQHYGRENTLRNNIFVFARDGQIIRSRSEKHLSFVIERNIVYFDRGTLLGKNWEGDRSNFVFDRNVYWDASGRPVTFVDKTLDDWQAQGQDQHSLVADPLFVDPDRYDFRLKANSPALTLGFQSIDAERIGLRGPRAWRELPTHVSRRVWPQAER